MVLASPRPVGPPHRSAVGPRRVAWAVALVGLSASTACRDEANLAAPSVAEARTDPVPSLLARLEAEEAATRGLEAARSTRRLDAAERCLVVSRRADGAAAGRLCERLLAPMTADRESPLQCRSARLFVELLHDIGRDDEARAEASRTLEDGRADLACRDALRALASSLGGAPEAEGGADSAPSDDGVTHAGSAATGRIRTVEVFGDQPESAAVRVVVTLDADIRGELLPARVVDGERRARLRFAAPEAVAQSAVRAVAAGGLRALAPPPAGESGLDLVLDPDARVSAYVLADPVRWVLDVERPAPPRAAGVRLVVLDPGHGGDEHGARVDGVRESHLVLDIAERTAASLRTRLPGTRVLLTRTTDDEVSLEQRSALANALGADLFVSIHLNDADVPVSTGGITSFVLDTEDERQALRLAARENGTTTDRVSGLSVLLAGLHRDQQVGESRRLASFVHGATLARARETLPRLPDRGVRSAGYYVLVGTRMPSMLIECSFMTRPEELVALRTEGHRARLATGIAEGIARYVATR